MDSPDQGVTDILEEKIFFKENVLHLELKSIGGIFEGTVSKDFLVIEGEWKQSGATLPITLRLVDKEVEIL